MENVRLNFAKLETAYKFRLITKVQLMNMMNHEWVSTYRLVTGISSDKNLLKHEEFIFEHYPNTYNYITVELFEHDFEQFVSSLAYIKQQVNERYKRDIENNKTHNPNYTPYMNK